MGDENKAENKAEDKVEETRVEDQVEETRVEDKPSEEKKEEPNVVTSSAVFSMFGGGAKKEKKPEEDRGDVSGSAKAQREAAAAKKDEEGADQDDQVEESEDIHFEPVIKLTEKVETKTNEESEECTFKVRAKLFKFVKETSEWKERGYGVVRMLKHKDSGKTRLVMRRDKTLKVCANHYISPDMGLMRSVNSLRSWVYTAVADVSEGEIEAMTLAIRFANEENANDFKEAFDKARDENEEILKEAAAAAEEEESS